MSHELKVTQERIFQTGIRIRDGEEYYHLNEQEKLHFGVKKMAYQSEYLIHKVLTEDDYDAEADSYVLALHMDELKLPAGDYVYDVALEYGDGELEKIIGCSPFVVEKSVVRNADSQD